MKNYKLKTVITVLSATALSFAGCSGGDTDGGKAGDETFEGTQFVPNSDNSGSLTLDVKETDILIADTAGFIVTVKDSLGVGVPQTQISCDSEAGVAILEPTTGAEITDSNGTISGRIGCSAPGSFQFGCRLPVGGNLRQFTTIKCSGAIPAGFNGFAGAAGGGIGTGGVAPTGDLRIAAIEVDDEGTTAGNAANVIDTTFGICSTDDPTTPQVEPTVVEPFFDGYANIKVVNNTAKNISFKTLRYSISGIGSSSSIAINGDVFADGGEKTIVALVFSVTGPGGSSKYVIRGSNSSNIPIPRSTGVKNVTFTLTGTNEQGESVSVSSSVAIAFDNYDNC